jgi:hypothetical protein
MLAGNIDAKPHRCIHQCDDLESLCVTVSEIQSPARSDPSGKPSGWPFIARFDTARSPSVALPDTRGAWCHRLVLPRRDAHCRQPAKTFVTDGQTIAVLDCHGSRRPPGHKSHGRRRLGVSSRWRREKITGRSFRVLLERRRPRRRARRRATAPVASPGGRGWCQIPQGRGCQSVLLLACLYMHF